MGMGGREYVCYLPWRVPFRRWLQRPSRQGEYGLHSARLRGHNSVTGTP